MLLSKQQRYILDLLRKLGGIRRGQLFTLIRNCPELPGGLTERQLEPMLRQLRCCVSDVRLEDDLVFLQNRQSNSLHLEAVDIMIELSEGKAENLVVNRATNLLLGFTLTDERIRLFSIRQLKTPAQPWQTPRAGMERIIWLNEGGTLEPGLKLPPKHFFAARQPDGSHRYYGSLEP